MAKMSSFVLVNSQNEVVQELEYILNPTDSVIANVMFAAPPLRLVTGLFIFIGLKDTLPCIYSSSFTRISSPTLN